jgi:hypothetical protein
MTDAIDITMTGDLPGRVRVRSAGRAMLLQVHEAWTARFGGIELGPVEAAQLVGALCLYGADLQSLTGPLKEALLGALHVEVLHERDPDAECTTRVWAAGAPVEVDLEDVDPGAGDERKDWDERIDRARGDVGAEVSKRSGAFREAVLEALTTAADSDYIDGQDEG